MSAPQFTPGPWFNDPCVTIYGEDNLPCVVDQHKLVVAQMLDDGHTDEECEANANLIAAAPDLYEALMLVSRNSGKLSHMDWQQVERALARARGEQP